MRDRVGKSAIEQRKPHSRKSRRDRIAISTVTVDVERRFRVLHIIVAVDYRYRNGSAIARGDFDPFGFIARRIIARGDDLRLEHGLHAARHVIGNHLIGGNHRFVRQPQRVDIIFGIVIKPGDIACLAKTDAARRPAAIFVQCNLIEAIFTRFEHKKASKC